MGLIFKINKYFHRVKARIFGSAKLTGKWFFEIKDIEGRLKKSHEFNLVPSVGLSAFASQFNSPTYNVGTNLYIALGTDNTTPTSGDTTLGNEVTRKIIASQTSSGATASVAVFFTASEATGTWEEFGLFGSAGNTQATLTANTGVLISHVTSPVVVSVTETLTVTFELTFSV